MMKEVPPLDDSTLDRLNQCSKVLDGLDVPSAITLVCALVALVGRQALESMQKNNADGEEEFVEVARDGVRAFLSATATGGLTLQ